MNTPSWQAMRRLCIIFAMLFIFAGCGREPAPERITLTAWFHTGRPEERRVIEEQVARFNGGQDEVAIRLTLIPEGDYNTQVQAAAADGSLPDILDLDGPYLANYAWKGHLLSLDALLPAAIKDDLLPSIIAQGTYNDRIYAIGTFDSGLAFYGNRQQLAAVGASMPADPEAAWSIDAFEDLLESLARQDPDSMVLDLRLDYRGEWFTYAFSPFIQSAGGDLIDRSNLRKSTGVLDSDAAVRAMEHVQHWFRQGYVDPNTDTNSFVSGRVALSLCGHWEYPRYKQALGTDLVLLPLPDFGTGSRTAMGSWVWAITRCCKDPQQAMEFLRFLLRKEEILAMCAANGAVPATRSAIAASPLYKPGGPLHLFVRQLETTAVPRPRTPAYPVITSAFQQAFQDIRNLADVRTSLHRAAAVIEEDIRDNEGYPPLQ